jgi:hypothetical protein
MNLFNRIKDRFQSQKEIVDEVVTSEDEIEIPATRLYVRAVKNRERKRGAGWTRSYQKGRTQR